MRYLKALRADWRKSSTRVSAGDPRPVWQIGAEFRRGEDREVQVADNLLGSSHAITQRRKPSFSLDRVINLLEVLKTNQEMVTRPDHAGVFFAQN